MQELSCKPSLKVLTAARFHHALSQGTVMFTPTVRVNLHEGPLIVEGRLVETLQKKPSSNLQSTDSPNDDVKSNKDKLVKFLNPFLPYETNLFVAKIPLTNHNILLNKFSIVKGHILLTTDTFSSQFKPPSSNDLSALAILLSSDKNVSLNSYFENKVYNDSATLDASVTSSDFSSLFAFFNCGPSSGASVLHKHFQLIPIDSEPSNINIPCYPPINNQVQESSGFIYQKGISSIDGIIPFQLDIYKAFAHSFTRIDSLIKFYLNLGGSMDENIFQLGYALRQVFEITLRSAFGCISLKYSQYIDIESMLEPLLNDEGFLREGVVPLIILDENTNLSISAKYFCSYNFIMTKDWMGVIPRKQERFCNQISINSCGFGGMVLVKNIEQLKLLEENGPITALESIAFPAL